MMEEKIEKIINELIKDEVEIYLVDFHISNKENKHTLEIFIDTDLGVTLDECSRFSKKFDAEIEEMQLFGDDQFVIEVSSPGLSKPLKLLRQFKKAIGKELSVTYKHGDEKVNKILKLREVNDDELHFVSKKDKEIINFDNIEKATYHLKW